MALDAAIAQRYISHMTLKQYLQHHKATELARQIGVPQALVSQWSTGTRQVPAGRCPQIEKATDGAVRCEELRPDIEWAVLRTCPQDRAA